MKRLVLPLFLILCSTLSSQVVLERDINEQPAPSNPANFIQLGANIYFEADDGINGSELYKYDLITEAAELIANIRPYEDGNNISELVALNGKVYFNAYDGVGSKPYLYVHDPVDNSTQRLTDNNNDENLNLLISFKEFKGINITIAQPIITYILINLSFQNEFS